MLLIHQAGSVHVGEVVRYTVTYTPSQDRILPTPTHLHLKIKNTSPIPLRAAYLHGPYSLYVSAYSSTFNPNHKVENAAKDGVPMFEPFLKAGSHWTCKLIVPEDIRESGESVASPTRQSMDSQGSTGRDGKSVTWIIEIYSQIIFSQTAAVHFEVLVGRDERSLDLGFAAAAAHGHGAAGQVSDHKKVHRSPRNRDSRSTPKGVYSRAIKLVVEDTEDLWDKPTLPSSSKTSHPRGIDEKDQSKHVENEKKPGKPKKKEKVHLVILTHGLHSNLSADMLYLKESIDATVAQARQDARERRHAKRQEQAQNTPRLGSGNKAADATDEPAGTAPTTGGQEDLSDDEDDEQVVVRGFSGNTVRTERGIQYLGKRLAKHILNITYPSQPYIPTKKKVTTSISQAFGSGAADRKASQQNMPPAHHNSSIHRDERHHHNDEAYQFTSISFVGHSLGGLVQLYAIGYLQKHTPDFFKIINPVNFICMASPLLGLSNENPMYIKFALDFGLVGRTGQDLGLTWRAPTIAKSGWSAIGGVFGSASKEEKEPDPRAKPLLRILPTGPAHQVLHLFRNRTVYSNVVNDGIVPLRTSCLLFLDWKGLAKIEKYRRQQGLLGTMVEWGWAEMTGANAERDESAPPGDRNSAVMSPQTSGSRGPDDTVPQPSATATEDDNKASGALDPTTAQLLQSRSHNREGSADMSTKSTNDSSTSMFDGILNFFRPTPTKSPKVVKALKRGQTLSKQQEEELASQNEPGSSTSRPGISRGTTDNPTMRPSKRPLASRGDSIDQQNEGLSAPPKTSIFESASDILHPPVPSTQWIIDPSSRSRTIFHDRVYHPADIPPPPRRTTRRTFSSDSLRFLSPSTSQESNLNSSAASSTDDQSGMKVEEKIARAYHRDLSWRKILVRLEPDAHNNMVVRRMFANAYGWPVIKHLCDTHFSDSHAARTRDEQESNTDRAVPGLQHMIPGDVSKVDDDDLDAAPARRELGEEVQGQTARHVRSSLDANERRETRDELGSLDRSTADVSAIEAKHRLDTDGSEWSARFFDGEGGDADSDSSGGSIVRTDGKADAVPRLRVASQRGKGETEREDGEKAGRARSATILDPDDLQGGHWADEPESMDNGAKGVGVKGGVVTAMEESLHPSTPKRRGI